MTSNEGPPLMTLHECDDGWWLHFHSRTSGKHAVMNIHSRPGLLIFTAIAEVVISVGGTVKDREGNLL